MESDYPSLPSYPPLPPPVSEEPTIQSPPSPLSLLSTNKPPESSSVSFQAPTNMSYNNRPTGAMTQQHGSASLMGTSSPQQYSSLPLQPTPSSIDSGVTSPHLVQHMALHSLHQPPVPPPSSSTSASQMSGSSVPISMLDVSNPIPNTSSRTPNVVGTYPQTTRSIPIGSGPVMDSSALVSGSTANTLQGGTPPNTDSTLLRLHYLEELCVKLTKEKKTIEDNFGRQRKKFMNHILQSDAAIATAKSTNENLSNEVRELSTQLLLKDEEVKDIRLASNLTQSQAREAFDADRLKYDEEIASLRQILSVQTQEHESTLLKEREQWQKDKDRLIADLKKLKAEEVAGHLSPGSRQSSPDDCLEASMAKAALDTQILRSVVVPLEQEVVALKKKLAEKEEKEKELLLQGSTTNSGRIPVTNLEAPAAVGGDNGSSLQEEHPPSNGGNKLQHQLELERSARHDLEMHARQVETQKSVLQEEVKNLKVQLEKVSRDLAIEENGHIELKKTWELANQHFIVAQDKLKAEIYRLHQKVERGEAASPLRQLPEFEVPQVKMEGGGLDTAKAALKLPRSHRRSLSTEESSDTNLLSSPQQRKSSSCNDIHIATMVTATNAADIGDLATKVTSLQTQLDGVSEELERRVAMCEGYEKQLLRVQEQMVAEMDDKELQIVRLKAELEKYKAGIMRERKLRQEMRKQIDGIRDEIGSRIEAFRGNESDVKQQLTVVKDKFTEITHDTQREIVRINNERGRLHQQMESAQEEYDCLKVLHAAEMKQLGETKAGKEEAELNLQSTMEQFSSLQSQASAREENIRKELAQVMEQHRIEKKEFETRWTNLMTVLEKSNAELEALKQELEKEKRTRAEAVSTKQLIEMKSKKFIADQQQKMESLNRAKENAEKDVRDLKQQLSQLKHHLSHSEETQKDYVELSQSLQKRLAEIEDLQQSQEVAPLSPSPT